MFIYLCMFRVTYIITSLQCLWSILPPSSSHTHRHFEWSYMDKDGREIWLYLTCSDLCCWLPTRVAITSKLQCKSKYKHLTFILTRTSNQWCPHPCIVLYQWIQWRRGRKEGEFLINFCKVILNTLFTNIMMFCFSKNHARQASILWHITIIPSLDSGWYDAKHIEVFCGSWLCFALLSFRRHVTIIYHCFGGCVLK